MGDMEAVMAQLADLLAPPPAPADTGDTGL